MRNQAMHGSEMKETILDFIFDYINDEIEKQEEDSIELWDWNVLKQNFSSHLLVSVELDSLRDGADKEENRALDDLSSTDITNFIFDQAKSVYATRESLIPEEVMRRFERFVVLRTIDEKWKDHLYAMDRVREGINLRAYGQKDPLLEYKSEGFALFQDMMADLNSTISQRLFRTQIQGMEQVSQTRRAIPQNVRIQHDDTTGMGFSKPPAGSRAEGQATPNQPQQAARTPIVTGKKIGRNDKILVVSPSGEKIEIKFKKLQQYLNQGYTQLS
jgi:preprotein translocase subunit SecA